MQPNKIIGYYKDGSIETEMWRVDDRLHRKNSPAYIEYHYDGSRYCEEWWLYGRQHREDGHAVIWYNTDGSVWSEEWWVNGEELTKNEIIAKKRKIMIDKILCDI